MPPKRCVSPAHQAGQYLLPGSFFAAYQVSGSKSYISERFPS